MESLEFRCRVRFLRKQCQLSVSDVNVSIRHFLHELQRDYETLTLGDKDTWCTVRFSEKSGLWIYSPKKDEGFESDSDRSEGNLRNAVHSSSSSGANSSTSDTEETETAGNSALDFIAHSKILNILCCQIPSGFSRVVLFALRSEKSNQSADFVAVECSSEESARILVNVCKKFTRSVTNKQKKSLQNEQNSLSDDTSRTGSLVPAQLWSNRLSQQQSSLQDSAQTRDTSSHLERPTSWNLIQHMDENGVTHLAITNTKDDRTKSRQLRKSVSESTAELPSLKLQTPEGLKKPAGPPTRKSVTKNLNTPDPRWNKSTEAEARDVGHDPKAKAIFDGCDNESASSSISQVNNQGGPIQRSVKVKRSIALETQGTPQGVPQGSLQTQRPMTPFKSQQITSKRTSHEAPITQNDQQTPSVTAKRGRDKSKALSFLLRLVSDSSKEPESGPKRERGRSLVRSHSRAKQRTPSQPPPQVNAATDSSDTSGQTFLIPTKSGAEADSCSIYPKEPHFILGGNYMVPLIQPHPLLAPRRFGLPTPVAYAPAVGLSLTHSSRQWRNHDGLDSNNNQFLSNQFVFFYPSVLDEMQRRRSRSQSPGRRLLPPTPGCSLHPPRRNFGYPDHNGPTSLDFSVNSGKQKKNSGGNRDDSNAYCDPRKVTFNAFATVQLLD